MKRHGKNPAILAMALGALVTVHGSVRADDTAAEIRLLKAKLKQLEDKVNEQARKQKETQVQVRAVAAQPGPGPTPAPYVFPVGIGAPPQPGPGGLTGVQTAVRGLPTIGPSSIWFKGITITPGGFLALESVTRSPFIGADIGTPYQNIPYSNVPASHTNEFRFSARQSRVSALMQGDVDPATHLAGYGELDFLGAAQTANSNESNSYNLRIRHLYATVDQDDFGAHLLAGQNWSLATMSTKGITPRQEDIPLTIDAQYVPGFVWARQPQIRITKDFDKTLWVALSAENPATTFGGVTPTLPNGGVIINSVVGGAATFPQTSVAGGTLFNNANAISLNQMPDIIGKVAWDPTIADRTIHMEAFGIFRDFVNRVIYPVGTVAFPFGAGLANHNNQVAAGGAGGSILVPVVPKLLDVQFSGMTGRGIGRYGTAQFPDVTWNADGSLAPIQQTMLLAGAIWHAFPELDLYAYAGQELQNPKFGLSTPGAHTPFGWGSPNFVNAGCDVEFLGAGSGASACTGNYKLIRQITAGFWDNIYKGPFGRLSGGLQYSFTQKFGFPGVGGTPSRNENVFLTSLRYYPF